MNQLNEMKLVQPDEPLEISGRRVLFHLFGPVGFSGWGTTTLRVEGAWLVEESTSLLGQKKRVLPLAGVEGFQVVTRGSRALLVFGVLLAPVFGIGLLLLVAWFFIRLRFLTIRHEHGSLSLRQWGDLPAYEEFLGRLMRALPAVAGERANLRTCFENPRSDR